MNGLDELKKRYPWPAERPEVVEDLEGWLHGDNRKRFAQLLDEKTQVVVELGSWLGMSAQFFCKHAPNATVICIDHWKGSREHKARDVWRAKLPTLFETFCRNLWPHRARVVPMKTTTLRGMAELAELGIRPDLLYVDASHEEEDVCDDVTTALCKFPGVPVIGDDWTWYSVRLGVVRATRGRHLRVHGIACWEVPIL